MQWNENRGFHVFTVYSTLSHYVQHSAIECGQTRSCCICTYALSMFNQGTAADALAKCGYQSAPVVATFALQDCTASEKATRLLLCFKQGH
jgi:hypothetical protein